MNEHGELLTMPKPTAIADLCEKQRGERIEALEWNAVVRGAKLSRWALLLAFVALALSIASLIKVFSAWSA